LVSKPSAFGWNQVSDCRRSKRQTQRDSCRTKAARESPRQHERPLHLLAAMFASQTPFAEVLAVIAEDVIAVLADPRPRSPNHFFTVEAGRTGSNPERMSMSELRESNLLHRPALKPMYQGAVVNDPAAADVDAVMGKPKARRNQV
jgi:hypothetical protein